MALSWQKRDEFLLGGHEKATAQRLSAEDLAWRKRTALGMKLRAEKDGFWQSRKLAVAWLEALEAEGDDSRWIHENKEKVFAGLDAEGWFEPSLTGAELMKAVDSVFGSERRPLRCS